MYEGHKPDSKYCSVKCKHDYDWKNKPIYQKQCAHCGNSFETKNNEVKYCSTTCVGEIQRLQALERTKTIIPRHIFPNKEARREYIRRKRIRDNFVDDVKIEILIERDKGICQLCNEPVLLEAHYQHPLSATNDHIIPVSLGGEHSYANCQLAHRKCNTTKNNRIEMEVK
jgi:5-methylcytosine-specific restriction endonuclease McrA